MTIKLPKTPDGWATRLPAKYRALSVEPLIGPLEIPPGSLKGIDLVIVGGESGAEARPMNPDWVRSARDACAREGVAFFFKQWGNWSPEQRFAKADLSNAAIFENAKAKPVLLSQLADVKERKAALQRLGVQAVFFTNDKHATGFELDGKNHKAHPFKGRPLEGHVKALHSTTAAPEAEQTSFGF